MRKPPSTPTHSAAELIPDRPTIDKVRTASKDCQACDLWRRGTQTVFDEGTTRARLMFVGEQPGERRRPERLFCARPTTRRAAQR